MFTLDAIPAGDLLWSFVHPDRKIDVEVATDEQLHYGFISHATGKLVICGDEARYWNFGDAPNCNEVDEWRGGEKVVRAILPIKAGEELLIAFESDADWKRKISYTSSANVRIPLR